MNGPKTPASSTWMLSYNVRFGRVAKTSLNGSPTSSCSGRPIDHPSTKLQWFRPRYRPPSVAMLGPEPSLTPPFPCLPVQLPGLVHSGPAYAVGRQPGAVTRPATTKPTTEFPVVVPATTNAAPRLVRADRAQGHQERPLSRTGADTRLSRLADQIGQLDKTALDLFGLRFQLGPFGQVGMIGHRRA